MVQNSGFFYRKVAQNIQVEGNYSWGYMLNSLREPGKRFANYHFYGTGETSLSSPFRRKVMSIMNIFKNFG